MQAVDKIVYSNDWITIIFLLLLASVVLLKLVDAKKLNENFFAFVNLSFIDDKDIERKDLFDFFEILIFIFSVIVLALVLYHFKLYKFPNTKSSLTSFIDVFYSLLIYYLFKRVFEYFLMIIFAIKNEIQSFILLKNNYLNSLSFFLLIGLILLEYSDINHLYLFFFAGFLFFLRFAFLFVRNKKLIFNKLFYFILYICALEIAPLFVLFKLMF